MTEWNEARRGEIELDALARLYVGDVQTTDRDRIAFALRELRKRGYELVEAVFQAVGFATQAARSGCRIDLAAKGADF